MTLKDAILKVKVLDRTELDERLMRSTVKLENDLTVSSIRIDKKFRTEHTKKQLEEADFGWVFDCPGIEVEEVEE